MGNFSPVTLHMGKFTSVTEVTDKSPENRAEVLPRSSMIVKNSPSVDRAHLERPLTKSFEVPFVHAIES